ncbi:MAG TPA: class I adenylate-forming enzyme family protein [Vicinamibacterales bacterium]|nr:class I adenylate-forming enzyme family protein [Vicinamibacterales bacterium]
MLLHRFLEEAAARKPERVALIEPQRQTTYGALDRLANRVAHGLIAAGVSRGDRVVIALDNCLELVATYLGTMKAGAVAVPLPPGPRSDRLGRAVLDCTPAAAVIDAASAREIAPGHPLAALRALFVSGPGAARAAYPTLEQAITGCPESSPGIRSIDADLAAIIYTSGSTGEPRGVMLTHRNFVANARSIIAYLRLTADDRVMSVLPFYYVYGLSLLHTHLAVGGSIVLDNRFTFPNVVLNAMRQHAVTGFAGVPSSFALLLHRSALDEIALPSLRYVTQAGGAMAPQRIREWLARGPKVPFYVMYGATEAAARLTYLEPEQLPAKIGSIGRAIPNVEILVVNEQDQRCGPGEVGELVARGANIARGYWNDADETAQKFGPLGYRTGDLGYADEDGYLFLVGRKHDMLKIGAHRAGAKEIEDVLQEFDGVHEVAVVGAPHDLLGEVAIAYLSLRDGAALGVAALEAFCRARLAPHKVPARFIVQPDLPKLGTGKIDKARLRELARETFVGTAF